MAHDYSRSDVLGRFLDELAHSNAPVTEAEIRALHPSMPRSFPLREVLERDPRITLHEGRWQSRAAVEAQKRGAELTQEECNQLHDWDEPVGRGFRFPWQQCSKATAPKAAKSVQPREPTPPNDRLQRDRLAETRLSSERPSVALEARSRLYSDDTALSIASLARGDSVRIMRAREVFAGFGYRVEGLGPGQLMLHAELGHRRHRVLLHVLTDDQRLDWAALLARRRESGATYLAVLGDHQDLHQITAPADLARATLWSWAGLERVVELSATAMLGPVDLEPHFECDGIFEYGLARLESAIAKRAQDERASGLSDRDAVNIALAPGLISSRGSAPQPADCGGPQAHPSATAPNTRAHATWHRYWANSLVLSALGGVVGAVLTAASRSELSWGAAGFGTVVAGVLATLAAGTGAIVFRYCSQRLAASQLLQHTLQVYCQALRINVRTAPGGSER